MSGSSIYNQLISSKEYFEQKALPSFDELLTNFEELTENVVNLFHLATESERTANLTLWLRTFFGIRDEYTLLHIGAIIRPYQKNLRQWPPDVQTSARQQKTDYELLKTEKETFCLVSCSERGLIYADRIIAKVRKFPFD